MPPVVERRGGEHCAAAPCGDKRSQGRTESQDIYGVGPRLRIAAEGGLHDDPGGAESAQQGAKLDQQMGRSPEAVAANGFMPGNVPVKPGGNTNGCNHVGPDQPGYGFRARQTCWPAYAGRSSNSAHDAPLNKILKTGRSSVQNTLNGHSV